MPVLTRKETLTIGSCSPSPDLSPADDLKKFIKLYTQYTGWGEKEKKKIREFSEVYNLISIVDSTKTWKTRIKINLNFKNYEET